MTYRFQLLFLVTLCFSSCSNVPSRVGNPEAPKSDQLQNTQRLDTALSFSGIWVNEEYIHKIKVNRSPRLSQEVEKSCIVIPPRTLEATNMIFSFHEGGPDMVIMKDKDNYLLFDRESKKYRDTITIISPTRIRIGDQFFSRLKHTDTTRANLGILEEILFAGHYRSVNGSKVVFLEDGSVKGLDSFKVYFPEIDYDVDDFDGVQLGQSMKELQKYGFRFNKDTLRIYKTRCFSYDSSSHACEKEVLGDQVYELTKLDP
jgi:hypothetical protein